jgi:hypothetical protein
MLTSTIAFGSAMAAALAEGWRRIVQPRFASRGGFGAAGSDGQAAAGSKGEQLRLRHPRSRGVAFFRQHFAAWE